MSEQMTEQQAIDLLQATGWMGRHDLEMTLHGVRMCREFMETSRRDRKWKEIGGGVYICPSCAKATTRHYEWAFCPVCGEDMRGGRADV